jgi:hypothetical protein
VIDMTNRTITLRPWEVLAYLDGRLRQIRRPVKMPKSASPLEEFHHCDQFGTAIFTGGTCVHPPFGAPGTLLVGRETWADANSEDGPCVLYRANYDRRHLTEESYPVDYDRYPGATFSQWAADVESGAEGRWRSPATMPRWASRITLRTVAVRVGRVQDISEDDAVACGFRGDASGPWGCEGLIEDAMAQWESDYGNWEATPLTWVGDIADERGSPHD